MNTLLAGWWRAEDGTRTMRVDAEGRVTVWRGSSVCVDDRPAKWHAPAAGAEASGFARARLGYLQVELGETGLGTTYDLMPAIANAGAGGPYDSIRVPSSAARAEVRLFPEGGASYYEAVLGYYDDFVEALRDADAAWMQPLATWWPSTEEECR